MPPEAPQPSSDERALTDEALGFELFWEKNKKRILATAAVLLLAGLVAAAWLIHSHSRRLAAEQALMAASSAEEYQEVARKFKNTPAAPTALALAAAKMVEKGQWREAAAEYEACLAAYPRSTLAGPSRLALAALALADGRQKQGLEMLAAAASDSDPYTTSMAMLLRARELVAVGEWPAARSALQTLISSHPRSPAAITAQGLIQQLAAIEPPPSQDESVLQIGGAADPSLPNSAPPPLPAVSPAR